MTIDSRLGGLYITGSPCLNFNKTKHIAIPADQVNLASVTWGPVVPGNHQVTKFPQMEVGVFLAATASPLMLRSPICREDVSGGPIEAADNRAGDRGWKHD
jgi:hypothetical protein